MTMTLFDLWYRSWQTHIFTKTKASPVPVEYDGQPYGKQTEVLNLQARHFPNYGAVIVAEVEDNDPD